eukprot:2677646-Amphidinium_carterae.1
MESKPCTCLRIERELCTCCRHECWIVEVSISLKQCKLFCWTAVMGQAATQDGVRKTLNSCLLAFERCLSCPQRGYANPRVCYWSGRYCRRGAQLPALGRLNDREQSWLQRQPMQHARCSQGFHPLRSVSRTGNSLKEEVIGMLLSSLGPT